MAYSEVSDLLLGNITVSGKIDKQKFIDDAADEIDSKLGFVYQLPLAPLADFQLTLLKQINNKLASGRLLLTLDISGEGTALHAYGLRLITEAENDLMQLANGAVDLDAVKRQVGNETRDMAPSLTSHDEESAVDMFESAVMRPGSAYWNPGEVVSREAAFGGWGP